MEKNRVGWTLDTSKQTDFILYTFDEVENYYLVPAEILRLITKRNYHKWMNLYSSGKAKSKDRNGRMWTTFSLFVPASIVHSEMDKLMWKASKK